MKKCLLFMFFVLVASGMNAQSNGSNQGSVFTALSVDNNTDDLKVYPNPASDYIMVSNGTNIKKIVVYNMFGKEVKTFLNYSNAQHEISDLKSGMYMVKMIDEKNKVVKSVKLNKNFTGV